MQKARRKEKEQAHPLPINKPKKKRKKKSSVSIHGLLFLRGLPWPGLGWNWKDNQAGRILLSAHHVGTFLRDIRYEINARYTRAPKLLAGWLSRDAEKGLSGESAGGPEKRHTVSFPRSC